MSNAFEIDVIDVQPKTRTPEYITVDSVKRAHTSNTIRKYGVTAQNFSPKPATTKQTDTLGLPLQSDIPERFQMLRGSLPSNGRTSDSKEKKDASMPAVESPSPGATKPWSQGPNGSSSGENPHATTGSLIEVEIMRNIIWKDGYLPSEQSKVPDSLLTLIRDHFDEFENEVVTTAWGKGKGCTEDGGRRVMYVLDDKNNSDIVPVARYQYGEKKQFLAAWLPHQTLPGSHHIHIVRFDSFAQTSAKIERNGIVWKMIPYTTWVPSDQYIAKTIWRLLEVATVEPQDPTSQESSQEYSKEIPPTNTADRDATNAATTRSPADMPGNKGKRPFEQDGQQSDVHHSHTPEIHRTKTPEAKKRRISINLPPPPIPPTPNSPSGIGMQSPSPSLHVVDIGAYVTTSATPLPIDSSTFLTQAQVQQDQNHCITEDYSGRVFVVCKDAQGSIQDTFPFHECNTAQKLFDAVCVSGIISVEPSATRLLKITFFPANVSGCIRPDSEKDFEKVVTSKLRALVRYGHVEIVVSFLR